LTTSKDVLIVCNQTLLAWHKEAIQYFHLANLKVDVFLDHEHSEVPSIASKFCIALQRRGLEKADHSNISLVDDPHTNSYKYVLYLDNSVNWGLQGTLGSIKITLGYLRPNDGNNHRTWVDVVSKKGLTPIGIWLRAKNQNDSRLISITYTTTDTIDIHRNYENAGYSAARTIGRLLKLYPNLTFESLPEINEEYPIESGSNYKMLLRFNLLFAKYLWKRFVAKSNKSTWEVRLRSKSESETSSFENLDLKKFKKFKHGLKGAAADPFIYEKNGTTALFYEFIPRNTKKGILCASTIDDDARTLETHEILEKDYHLAYPHVFEYNDVLYMIPDSGHNNTVDLYHCIKFPFEWEFKMTLINGINAVDVTPLFHQNKWWLFCNVVDQKGLSSFDHLHIYFSDILESTSWETHPLNPVKSNAGNSRPAGSFSNDKGTILRPAQNSSFEYGYGLVINEITELTNTKFAEHPITQYNPSNSSTRGMHTLNGSNNWEVIDVKVPI
jgi:hypothetical protein